MPGFEYKMISRAVRENKMQKNALGTVLPAV